jgi:hypothetical protein
MRAMREVERSMSSAWLRGHRTADWARMETEVAKSLIDSFDRGRRLYFRDRKEVDSANEIGSAPMVERARAMVHQTVVETAGRRENLGDYYGLTMVAILFLLFFDEDDATVFRGLERGIPAATARRAAANDVAPTLARRAHEIITADETARAVVRTVPRRSELTARNEVRRALNLGIAEGALDERRTDRQPDPSRMAIFETDYPLWMIREVMDRRTRGNPSGDFPDGGFHWQVNGYVNTIDEIIRQGCVPPCGRNCRATLVPLTWRMVERMDLLTEGRVDSAKVRSHNGDRQGYIDRGLYPDPVYSSFR